METEQVPQPAKLKLNDAVMGAQAVDKKPDLSLAMMRVVRGWAGSDANIGTMFNILLAGQKDAATEIFDALRDRDLRVAALMAVAKVKLSAELCADIRKYYEGWRKASRVRNEIAHGIWLYTESYPNDLCTIDVPVLADVFRSQFLHTRDNLHATPMLKSLQEHLVGVPVTRYCLKDFEIALESLIKISMDGAQICTRILTELAASDPKLFLPEH